MIFSQTNLYTEDWIGLRTLDEAGKVKFINVSGNHLEISVNDMKKYIVPFLKDETSEMVESSSGGHLSPMSFAFEKEDRSLLHFVGYEDNPKLSLQLHVTRNTELPFH